MIFVSIKDKHNIGAYQKAKERTKARSAAITLAGQDIAPIPLPKDQARQPRADLRPVGALVC
jgi:hypothetical protein